MSRNHVIKGCVSKWIMIALALTMALASAGCDYGLGALNALNGLQGLAGYGGWDTYGSYPDYGSYDPTGGIQSVIDCQQDVMDWSENAWDGYILQ